MIPPEEFISAAKKSGIDFITGVPDSLLKDLCACITDSYPVNQHIIASNEGSAIALGMGHFLATNRLPLIYMQNSGLGNIVNPLTSLADPEVYSIPMLLMIGWRGEILDDGTQIHDEPQHVKQGRITLKQLDILEIPYHILDNNTQNISNIIQVMTGKATERSGPVALVARKGTFSEFRLDLPDQDPELPTREEAIRTILDNLPGNIPIVSTTGMASREVFEIRKQTCMSHEQDFLTVGGMGHASQIAAGIALARPGSRVVCIDGDGAVLMHTGALAINADCHNLIHIVINNEAHDSVGGQPTKGSVLNFAEIARNFGYQTSYRVNSIIDLQQRLHESIHGHGSIMIEIKCRCGSQEDLGRPDRTPVENKIEFMQNMETSHE